MLQLNTVSLYQVMRDFHILTKIRIVIFDAEFRELLAYPKERERFCELLRNTPEGERDCQVSDKNGCVQCTKSKDLVTYRCHAGLTEAVVPIIDKSEVLAYVMFGQIIPQEDCEATRNKIRMRYPQYEKEVDQIPVKTEQEIGAVITVLRAITAYMMTNRWVVPNKSEFIRQIDYYIENHLAHNITVEDFGDVFRIGRTKLYEISMDYLGCGLAEYIRRRRIHHAQRMLEETSLSIAEIAYAAGFSDYIHFSRVFRLVTGMSARDYRKADRQTKRPDSAGQAKRKSLRNNDQECGSEQEDSGGQKLEEY